MAAFVANESTSSITREECLEIFGEFDADCSGTIDSSEFQAVACALGHVLSDGQVEEAMKELDTDGNGTIDFEEFFAWVCSDKATEQDASVAAWELALLKAKLAAFFYKKKVENANKRMVSRFLAASGEVPEGSTSISLNINHASPRDDGMGIEVSTEEPDGEASSVSMFVTVREGASQEDVDAVISVIKEGLEMVPLAQMVPGFEELSVDSVDHESGRAIRLKLASSMNPIAAVESMGVQPSDVKAAVKLSFGSDMAGLFSGEGCLRDMLKARAQVSLVIPNSIKNIIRATGMLPPQASWALLMNHLEFSVGVDSLFEWGLSQKDMDEQKLEMVNAVLDMRLAGFIPFVHSLFKLGHKTLQEMPPSAGPPVMQAAVANFDAFACLDSFWGVKLNLPAIALQVKMTGCNPFTLIPTAAEREAAADVEIGDEGIGPHLPESMKALVDLSAHGKENEEEEEEFTCFV